MTIKQNRLMFAGTFLTLLLPNFNDLLKNRVEIIIKTS